MNIVVCIKKIPDPEIPPAKFKLDSEAKQVLPPEGIPPVINPYDEQAVELALRLKEKEGGKVIILTIDEEASPTIEQAPHDHAHPLLPVPQPGPAGPPLHRTSLKDLLQVPDRFRRSLGRHQEPYEGPGERAVQFDGTGSGDDVGVARYGWDSADGTEDGNEPAPTHIWPDDGEYTLYLTVSDTPLSRGVPAICGGVSLPVSVRRSTSST